LPTLSAIEWLARLVACDTTSRLSNLALIDMLRVFLESQGIKPRIIPNAEGTKANLFATIGPDSEGGVVLSGHTDVVPVVGQPWDTKPFELTERGGLLYGRGTADMKSFIACALAEVPRWTELPLTRPIHLACSYDEEVGCFGVHHMVADIVAHLPRPAIVIVGEPTSMKVVNAHKSVVIGSTKVTGLEAHSSNTHLGVNAILYANRLIGFLSQLAVELKIAGDPSRRFDPPYSTVNIGTISGGTAQNIIPRHCQFTWEFRLLPPVDDLSLKKRFDAEAARLETEMQSISPDCSIETTILASVPALTALEGSSAEAFVHALTRANSSLAVSYATEAGIFQVAGMPAVVCGPGNIRQAHQPNEFIEVAQIHECTAFMRRLGAQLA
jgi:acetylornithine deacetylase